MVSIRGRRDLEASKDLANKILIGQRSLSVQGPLSHLPLAGQSSGPVFMSALDISSIYDRTYQGNTINNLLANQITQIQDEVMTTMATQENLSMYGRKILGVGRVETPEMRRLRAKALIASGEFDLQMLNRQQQSQISTTYVNEVLKLREVLEKKGMPGLSLPTRNPYNEFYNYLIDPTLGADPNQGIHPMSVALGRASISVKVGGGTIEDAIKTSRGKVMTSSRANQLTAQSRRMLQKGEGQGLNIYGVNLNGAVDDLADLGAPYDIGRHQIGRNDTFYISTMDIETTGISPDSQTRTLSILRRKARYSAEGALEFLDESNNVIDDAIRPQDIRSFHIRTTRMNAARVTMPDGTRMPLSEMAVLRESGGQPVYQQGEEALGAFTDAMKYIMGEDLEAATGVRPKVRLAGHNVGSFDIRFLMNNMLEIASEIPAGMPAETMRVMGDFTDEIISNPFFITDTMDATFIEMSRQTSQISEMLRMNGVPDDRINNIIYETFLDKSLRTKAAITGERSNKAFCRKFNIKHKFTRINGK
jgi:hypothetical protein